MRLRWLLFGSLVVALFLMLSVVYVPARAQVGLTVLLADEVCPGVPGSPEPNLYGWQAERGVDWSYWQFPLNDQGFGCSAQTSVAFNLTEVVAVSPSFTRSALAGDLVIEFDYLLFNRINNYQDTCMDWTLYAIDPVYSPGLMFGELCEPSDNQYYPQGRARYEIDPLVFSGFDLAKEYEIRFSAQGQGEQWMVDNLFIVQLADGGTPTPSPTPSPTPPNDFPTCNFLSAGYGTGVSGFGDFVWTSEPNLGFGGDSIWVDIPDTPTCPKVNRCIEILEYSDRNCSANLSFIGYAQDTGQATVFDYGCSPPPSVGPEALNSLFINAYQPFSMTVRISSYAVSDQYPVNCGSPPTPTPDPLTPTPTPTATPAPPCVLLQGQIYSGDFTGDTVLIEPVDSNANGISFNCDPDTGPWRVVVEGRDPYPGGGFVMTNTVGLDYIGENPPENVNYVLGHLQAVAFNEGYTVTLLVGPPNNPNEPWPTAEGTPLPTAIPTGTAEPTSTAPIVSTATPNATQILETATAQASITQTVTPTPDGSVFGDLGILPPGVPSPLDGVTPVEFSENTASCNPPWLFDIPNLIEMGVRCYNYAPLSFAGFGAQTLNVEYLHVHRLELLSFDVIPVLAGALAVIFLLIIIRMIKNR